MDYTSLRDQTAAALIASAGHTAVLRQQSGQSAYDPSTGKNTIVTQDTTVRVLEVGLRRALKGRELNEFEQEQVQHADSGLVMSAKETAIAGVEPKVGDQIILGPNDTRKIAWIDPVRPGGVVVIYKVAISR